MKIVMLGPYPRGENIQGGIEMHMLNLSNSLSILDEIDLHVITLGDVNTEYKSEECNISIIKHSHFPPLDIRRLKKKIDQIKPNVLHCQGTYFPYSTTAAILSGKYNTILTVHGLISHEINFMGFQDRLECIFMGIPLEKYALIKINNIIICSPAMNQLLNVNSKSIVNLIPNGVKLPDIVYDNGNKSLKNPSILFIGTLEKIKGVDTLIRAFHELISLKFELYLYLIGDGSQRAYLEKLCQELNIEKNVIFLGYLDNKGKNFFYRNTDIFVLPSRYESFGLVILEAMSFGKPVVASNVGGIPSIISHNENGLLFESENSIDLSKKINYLLNNKNVRLKLAKEAQKTAMNYEWNIIANKTFNIYQKMHKG